MDPKLQELLDKAKEALGNQAEMAKTINEIKGWGADNGRIKQAEDAIKQLEAAQKTLLSDIEKRVALATRRAYDTNGRYRGYFASEDQARSFALIVLSYTGDAGSDLRRRSADMLKTEFKDLADRYKDVTGDQALIPHEHSTRMLRLIEDSSVWATRAFMMPMTSAELSFSRRVSGMRAHKTKIRTAVTRQDMVVAPVNLTASDYDILTSYPKQLEADALVVIAEMMLTEMGLGFSLAIEENGIIGDASNAYDNEMGIVSLLSNINGVDDGGGLVLGTGAGSAKWSSLTKDDVFKLVGRARYVRPGQGRYVCSAEFFWTVLAKLISDAGGRTMAESVNGGISFNFFGVPVDLSYAMPRTAGNSQICLLYGDIYQSSTYGNRQQYSVETSKEAYFTSKEIGVLATARFAINNHSLGDATTAGPVVGLITPAA